MPGVLNQKLYGFVAEIDPTLSIDPNRLGATYSKTSTGINLLLQDLSCLQCRVSETASSMGKVNKQK